MKEFINYDTVSQYSTSEQTLVPASGTGIRLIELGANGALNHDVKVEIRWDGDLIFVAHEASSRKSRERLFGDGSKALSIKLFNETSGTETFGGYVLYEGL